MHYVMIKYHNDTCDFVDSRLADKLIASGKIKQFYRGSQKKWITPGVDMVRGKGGDYRGRERRNFPLQKPPVTDSRQAALFS